MTLPNGITAFCSTSEQCGNGYWCHKIGYNGYGFCCSGAEERKQAACPPVTALKNTSQCSSVCRTDHDCVNGVCCFDGCGLSCFSLEDRDISPKSGISNVRPPYQLRGVVTKHNKGEKIRLADIFQQAFF
ncbi:hypothetical protein KIN20_034220 [Parelaphostrongylus tenuis]|uniref:WAP domain-containing protein n=1 Tax=Parelaphostrongylus tenuis TaxID=148309 RepID=A0AAD5WJI1_PARTN|nr:hypothetical protein KIN20_034220 [Parelaphostrongylus tenuis]